MKFGGAYQKQDFKTWDSSPIEKTHLHFCKRYLEVSNKASNAACRGELGRFPLIFGINENILNYIMYLFEKDEDSIVKQALLLSRNLHSNGNTSFYSNIMELSKSYNLPNFVPNNLDKTKISRYKDIMKQKYVTQWRYSVNYTRKLEFCNTFKHCYEISSYLNLTRKTINRKALVKLRVSNHKLLTTKGYVQFVTPIQLKMKFTSSAIARNISNLEMNFSLKYKVISIISSSYLSRTW